MTQCFLINDNNDIYLNSTGKIAIGVDIYALNSACKTAAQAQQGEMPLAQEQGIPNFDVTWTGGPRIALFELFLREAIEDVEGVIKISDLSTNVSNNVLEYSAEIKTEYGSTSVQG